MKKKLQKPEVKGSPATILYKKMPEGMILITGFENFLTENELEAKFGETITNTYLAYPGSIVKAFFPEGEEYISIGDDKIAKGEFMTRQEFSMLVNDIKKAGILLHEIILSQDNEIRRIRI